MKNFPYFFRIHKNRLIISYDTIIMSFPYIDFPRKPPKWKKKKNTRRETERKSTSSQHLFLSNKYHLFYKKQQRRKLHNKLSEKTQLFLPFSFVFWYRVNIKIHKYESHTPVNTANIFQLSFSHKLNFSFDCLATRVLLLKVRTTTDSTQSHNNIKNTHTEKLKKKKFFRNENNIIFPPNKKMFFFSSFLFILFWFSVLTSLRALLYFISHREFFFSSFP